MNKDNIQMCQQVRAPIAPLVKYLSSSFYRISYPIYKTQLTVTVPTSWILILDAVREEMNNGTSRTD